MNNSKITIVSKTKAGEDEYGMPVWVETETETPALVAWGGTSETWGLARIEEDIDATIFFNDFIDLNGNTDLIIKGKRYFIKGEPLDWDAPAGWKIRPGVVVYAKRKEG